LDGGRNTVACKNSSRRARRKTHRTKTCLAFSQDEICRQRIVAHSWQRFFRSASRLADSSKMETWWRLSTTSHAVATRNNRRPHDRMVSAMSALKETNRNFSTPCRKWIEQSGHAYISLCSRSLFRKRKLRREQLCQRSICQCSCSSLPQPTKCHLR